VSYQDKLARATSRIRRHLFDYKVSITGTQSQVLRFKVTTNEYQDREYELINYDLVPFYIKLPEAIPMSRFRSFDNPQNVLDQQDADTGNIYLYDILPIEGYSRFADDVEKGDLIIKRIEADDDNTDPYLFILQVAETLGNIDQERIVWKRHNCAPYTRQLPPEVISLIDQYKNEIF